MSDRSWKKPIAISELRRIVRSVLKEVLQEEEDDDILHSKTMQAPSSHATAVAKTQPAPPNVQSGPGKQLHVPSTGKGDARLTHHNQIASRPTTPAHASNAERAMKQDFREKGTSKTGSPQLAPTTLSPQSQKAGMIVKKLQAKNVSADEPSIKNWLDQMDPTDVLIRTADDLADEYMGGPNTIKSAV